MEKPTMNCPKCGREMRTGTAGGNRIDLKWLDDEHADDERLFLPYKHLFCGGEGETVYYCPDCGVVAMMAEEFENPLRKMADKLKTITEIAAAERERISEEHREEQKEKARNKRRKNDPWEG